jgi:hypothetical protein
MHVNYPHRPPSRSPYVCAKPLLAEWRHVSCLRDTRGRRFDRSVANEKGHDVVCFMAAIGQEEDFRTTRDKALKIGAKEYYINDLNEELVKELCFWL